MEQSWQQRRPQKANPNIEQNSIISIIISISSNRGPRPDHAEKVQPRPDPRPFRGGRERTSVPDLPSLPVRPSVPPPVI